MLDLKWIRNHPEELKDAMRRRGADVPVDELISLDRSWRQKLSQGRAPESGAERGLGGHRSRQARGKDAAEAIARMKEVAAQIRELDQEVSGIEARIQELLLLIPNVPHESVPDGQSDADNVEVRRVGEPRDFGFKPNPIGSWARPRRHRLREGRQE